MVFRNQNSCRDELTDLFIWLHEIWIDLYPLTRFLAKHTQAAVKVEGTKEWVRTSMIVDPAVEECEMQSKMEIPTRENTLEGDFYGEQPSGGI